MVRTVNAIALFVFLGGEASQAHACPFCESTTADQVRAGIFNSDFVYHLGVSFAPFLILLAILILIYYWPARRSPRFTLQPLQRHDSHVSQSEQL